MHRLLCSLNAPCAVMNPPPPPVPQPARPAPGCPPCALFLRPAPVSNPNSKKYTHKGMYRFCHRFWSFFVVVNENVHPRMHFSCPVFHHLRCGSPPPHPPPRSGAQKKSDSVVPGRKHPPPPTACSIFFNFLMEPPYVHKSSTFGVFLAGPLEPQWWLPPNDALQLGNVAPMPFAQSSQHGVLPCLLCSSVHQAAILLQVSCGSCHSRRPLA